MFRAVAEQLSFHKAAKQLFLTQPAVTLQIKALEDDLGIGVFDRAGGHVSLTREGALLLRHAQKLAALASDAEQELAAAKGQLAGKLALGVSTTILVVFIGPELNRTGFEGHVIRTPAHTDSYSATSH